MNNPYSDQFQSLCVLAEVSNNPVHWHTAEAVNFGWKLLAQDPFLVHQAADQPFVFHDWLSLHLLSCDLESGRARASKALFVFFFDSMDHKAVKAIAHTIVTNRACKRPYLKLRGLFALAATNHRILYLEDDPLSYRLDDNPVSLPLAHLETFSAGFWDRPVHHKEVIL